MSPTEEAVRYFGDVVHRFLTEAGKSGHTPVFFDVKRRTAVGTAVIFDLLPPMLDALEATSRPEEIGAASRRLAAIPANYQLNAVPFGYLIGRQNELLLGRGGGSGADLDRVMDWWVRAMTTYRDGTLSAYDDGGCQRVVDDDVPLRVLDSEGTTGEEDAEYRKLTSALQVYNYVQRGEQRGTTFFHGPYPGRDGRTVFVEEFTRLRDNELIWSADPSPFPVDTVCAIVESHDVDYRFDLFQGMVASDPEYHRKVARVAIVTCDDGEPRRLTDAERHELLEAAAAEQQRLFRETIAWDDQFKLVYGAYLYLDFFVPLLRAGGVPERTIAIFRERFRESGERRAVDVAAMDPVPVWGRLLRPDGPVFDLS